MSVYTAVYSFELYTSGSWNDYTSSIVSVDGAFEANVNRDNGLAFGDSSEVKLTANCTLGVQSVAWENTPFRVTFQVNANSIQVLGIITDRDRELDSLSFACEGFAALIRNTKEYSPAFHRTAVATRTTAVSVEDPGDVAYEAGPVNYILWSAGGRPLEQDFAFPNAVFYYSCDQALLAPDWAWVAGENGWDECLKLVQASSGQLYQQPDGVIRYRQPYTIADGSVVKTFTTSDFLTIREHLSSHQLIDKATISYIPRALRPMQDICEDDTSRVLQPLETISFDLEPQWPLYSLEQPFAGQLNPGVFQIFFLGGGAAVMNTDYYASVTFAAARISIEVYNASARPIEITKVTLRGEPISAGVAGSVTVGSGTIAKNVVADNPYIQSRSHAERLGNLFLAFYASAHAVRTLSGCVYDPTMNIGDLVNLTVAAWSVSAEPHSVLAIRHSQTGAQMEIDIVSVAGIKKTSDFFIVGTDYSASGNKYLGY